MTPEEITAWAAVAVTLLTSLIVPAFLRRRKAAREAGSNEVVSWQGITTVLQNERDDLRKRLDVVENDYKRRLRELDVDYKRQLDEATERIKQLEAEVADLYRRLYRAGPNP